MDRPPAPTSWTDRIGLSSPSATQRSITSWQRRSISGLSRCTLAKSRASLLSPDATVDIYETGLTLTGGGAQLDGIEGHFREALGLSVTVAKEPANAAAVGAGRLLAHPESLGRVALRESVWLWRSAKGFVSA